MATDDLHARLVAAVTARLELTRTARTQQWYGRYEEIIGKAFENLSDSTPVGRDDVDAILTWVGDDNARLHGWSDPADAIRRHEAALRVLQRHRPQPGDWSLAAGHEHEICCRACAEIDHDVSQPWPCDDIRDVAASYGEVI